VMSDEDLGLRVHGASPGVDLQAWWQRQVLLASPIGVVRLPPFE
jgi:hypothetical protein